MRTYISRRTCCGASIALAEEKGWDHLTLLGAPKLFTLWRKNRDDIFRDGVRDGHAAMEGEQSAIRAGIRGVGAFQMIRRSTYEKMGTHRRLAMEVIDDMKLGKLVKEAGGRSGVAMAGDAVSVHWHAGLGNTIRGTTKNFFAAAGFKLWLAARRFWGCC